MLTYKCDRCKCDIYFPSGKVSIAHGNRRSFYLLCWDCAQKLIEFIEKGDGDDASQP